MARSTRLTTSGSIGSALVQAYRLRYTPAMSGASATILAAVIAAGISLAVAIYSQYSVKRSAENVVHAEVNAKLSELKQLQISDVIQERVQRYPSLWQLCQIRISVQLLKLDEVQPGWESRFSDELEKWHADHGIFLSEECYQGLHALRRLAKRHAAEESNAGKTALDRLKALDEIWSHQFFDFTGKPQRPLSYQLKNDLGSYERAALSNSITSWRREIS